ncbi:tRNA (adenine(22)-N(1))-methyltransferase [Enterococcus cecorum]|uniref:tRNA (adenine(22)-N(1))-methyltransferase n=1 Tax=Enterococcus cecorum TaxID=44008 RepID=UPI000B37486C|nr:tRNA (adenine(22)-N(1))-methyltransferase TrmK [Enterococcus cecorum]MCJ0544600.1 tRNA (adenine(22)-N(1))-methyltransferase TrmK [Enterococcus cecorum]MCJ0548938.1 tRNA (adenine(22)-N(1))-methyltransferase TrmK [Enterococcus cecorum]MCJ0601263.1 tRNA (adenine(22)-N(1))-methyltransferase TrmK [Enterococcus cecorum]MCJ0605758.1 tRNA (adenine(22)-N(1))-methyltransferase TrmK [Enterococcus cecorum]OUN51397.1 SAM-dependent methyltransferase [Enterococcus cecorum]
MNAQQLSKRLAKVGEFVPNQARLADIGSDHAYLPVRLMLANKISYAVCGEVVKGPYESAVHQVTLQGLADKITVRLADGLFAIEPSDNIDTITICGMGGTLIKQILLEGIERITGEELLVLQPNVGEATLRKYLVANGYTIIAEEILEENKKIYEIIVAKKLSQPMSLNEAQYLFGPHLMQAKTPIFIKKWQRELKQRQKVLQQLQKATTKHMEKMTELEAEIKLIEEVLV